MDIIKYKKIGKNKYKITLSNNEKIVLYEDIILEFNLLLKKKIDNLNEIIDKNKDYEVYDLALSYINKKQRCESEIKDYLLKKGYNNKIIDKTIIKLKKINLINEKLYIKAFANDKFNLNNYGPNKIINELIRLKLDKNLILENVKIDKEEIYIKLDKLIDKKIKSLKKYTGNVLKYKLEAYFVNLGYDKEDIDKVLDEKDLDNSINYDKEYKELYEKYSKKYSGYELEIRIKQKLYEKGFRK